MNKKSYFPINSLNLNTPSIPVFEVNEEGYIDGDYFDDEFIGTRDF